MEDERNRLPRRNSRSLVRFREKHETPSLVVWELTLSCNLGCKHCGSRAGVSRSDELTTSEAIGLTHQLAEIGVSEVVLIGGEAYLREDWDEIAAHISANGMACSIVTGARDFNDDRIDRAVLAGVKQIGISIDGLSGTHDALRGVRGSFESAIETSRKVREAGLALTINTQINRLSLPELPSLCRLIEGLGAVGWQVMLTVPMGRAADRPQLLLQPFHLLRLIPLLIELQEDLKSRGNMALVAGNNIGYEGISNILLLDAGGLGTAYAGCQAGKFSLGIEADGKIKGCPSLPTVPYAGQNIREAPLKQICSSKIVSKGSDRQHKDLWGFCGECRYSSTCKGGCTWTAHTLLGTPGNNPYCYYRATEFAKLGLKETVQRVAIAEGRPFDYGEYRISVEPFSLAEPVQINPIERLEICQLMGLKPNAASAWNAETIRKVLDFVEPIQQPTVFEIGQERRG